MDNNQKIIVEVKLEEANGLSWVVIACQAEHLQMRTKVFRDPRKAFNIWLNVRQEAPIRRLAAKYGSALVISRRIPSIGNPVEGGD